MKDLTEIKLAVNPELAWKKTFENVFHKNKPIWHGVSGVENGA